MQRYTVYFIWKLLYMFRVVPPSNIRSANNCIYNIWYLSHRYCYLPLSWKSWNWFEGAVGGVLYTQQWFTSYRFADSLQTGSGWDILILLASCPDTIVVYTVKYSWWWTEELFETCRVSFQNKIFWEISAYIWFYYMKSILMASFTLTQHSMTMWNF